mgnify:CR=1 FL=1
MPEGGVLFVMSIQTRFLIIAFLMIKTILVMMFPVADNPYKSSGRGDDKNIQQVQVIKRIVNTGVKYDGFEEDVASWDKYGDKDWTTDWDLDGEPDD